MKDTFKVTLGFGLGLLVLGVHSCANINDATPMEILGIFVTAGSAIALGLAEL